jgi:hypothetical protein
MMRSLTTLLAAALAASLLAPVMAAAKPADKRETRIIVFPKPKQNPRNGFLPGYRQPPALAEWRDRSPQYGGGDFSRDRRYWSGWEWRYGWGGPTFYRGRYNGGSFGPCWTQTPIGPQWNCGM